MPSPDSQSPLTRLLGAWVAEERLSASPFFEADGTATSRAVNRNAVSGRCVLQEYTQYRDGRITREAHAVFWFDPAADEYVMTWFDDVTGTPAEYRGTPEGDVLTLTTRAAKPQARATVHWTGPHAYRFLGEYSADGLEWRPFVEAEYERVMG